MTRRRRVRDLPATHPQELARSATPPPQEAHPHLISPAVSPEEPREPIPFPLPVPPAAVPESLAGRVPTVAGELVPDDADPVQLERSRLVRAKRDATGFITDALPHVTAAQLRWLTYRLESGDDREACGLAEIDPFEILKWMADPGFRATYEQALDNKREGFKTLTSHLLPSVIRSLQEMLDRGSMKDKKEASALILRAQGLMVDKQATTDPSAIQSLFALLREERPVEARVLDVPAQRIRDAEPD